MRIQRRRKRCHTPEKIVYRFEGEARHAATEAAAQYHHAMDAYRCSSCGFWHITKVKR